MAKFLSREMHEILDNHRYFVNDTAVIFVLDRRTTQDMKQLFEFRIKRGLR